jgi:hypothetical protein
MKARPDEMHFVRRPTCVRLTAPDRRRISVTTWWDLTAAIMNGTKPEIWYETESYARSVEAESPLDDYAEVPVPELAFLNTLEIRTLKIWCEERTGLAKSGIISRSEKLLHLVFLMQYRCGFGTIARWFSRTPRQVHK